LLVNKTVMVSMLRLLVPFMMCALIFNGCTESKTRSSNAQEVTETGESPSLVEHSPRTLRVVLTRHGETVGNTMEMNRTYKLRHQDIEGAEVGELTCVDPASKWLSRTHCTKQEQGKNRQKFSTEEVGRIFDSELTAKGYNQALKMAAQAKRLIWKKTKPDLVLVSPLRRTIQTYLTSMYTNFSDVPIKVLPLLHEECFSNYNMYCLQALEKEEMAELEDFYPEMKAIFGDETKRMEINNNVGDENHKIQSGSLKLMQDFLKTQFSEDGGGLAACTYKNMGEAPDIPYPHTDFFKNRKIGGGKMSCLPLGKIMDGNLPARIDNVLGLLTSEGKRNYFLEDKALDKEHPTIRHYVKKYRGQMTRVPQPNQPFPNPYDFAETLQGTIQSWFEDLGLSGKKSKTIGIVGHGVLLANIIQGAGCRDVNEARMNLRIHSAAYVDITLTSTEDGWVCETCHTTKKIKGTKTNEHELVECRSDEVKAYPDTKPLET